MCPAVMKYNLKHSSSTPKIAHQQDKTQEILQLEPESARMLKVAGGLSQDSADLGDLLNMIIRALGLPMTLKELDVESDVVPKLSKRAVADFWAPTYPMPLWETGQLQEILEAVM